mgnify:CR=1 FL=1
MEYICIIIVTLVICIVIAIILKLNPKKIKQIAEDDELNKIAEKFPSNIEICKKILKMLNNENVKIEEDNEAKDCLYMVAFNKIIIAGTQKNFTRIQTIAHECLHSVQEKRIQMFNFVFSNICILYFIVILALGILKLLPNKMLFLTIYILLSFAHFFIRAYLENDAMIKAKYLAKEYLEEKNISTKEEIAQLIDGYTRLNNEGIKAVNYQLFIEILTKVIIFSVVALIF